MIDVNRRLMKGYIYFEKSSYKRVYKNKYLTLLSVLLLPITLPYHLVNFFLKFIIRKETTIPANYVGAFFFVLGGIFNLTHMPEFSIMSSVGIGFALSICIFIARGVLLKLDDII